jgi:phenylacetate-CoA ligase
MDFETKLNTQEMQTIQWGKLTKKLEYLYNAAPFWKDWMDKAGARPGNIKTWDDFRTALPLFTKEDYREYSERCDGNMERILEGLMGEDGKKLTLIAATSGTTGDPTPYPFTEADKKAWSEVLHRQLWRCEIFPGDKILQAFGLSMFIAGVPVCIGIADYGACCIPVGAESGTETIMRFAHLFKPDALLCTPSLAEYMMEKAPDVFGEPVAALNIKSLICGGEPGAGIPEVRRKIEGAFGAKLFDFGWGGCSCDHPEYQGLHYLIEDLILLEIVDPETHEYIPMEDGAKGLIVHTQLDGSIGWAGLRQSMNDIIQVFTAPCPCGKTGIRFKAVGRADDMLKVKGVMVYPPAVEGVINGFVPKVTGEFRIVLEEPPPRVVPPLKLKVEYSEGTTEDQLDTLAEEITEAMHRRVKIRPKIIWVPPNSLERFLKKKKLFEKTYDEK